MTAVDYVVNLVLSGILIVGAYQFYFFTQRHPLRPARVLHSPLDEKIPFVAWWSWVYSFIVLSGDFVFKLVDGGFAPVCDDGV